jgi:ubiquitin-conjugating enzyme E2 Q
LAIGERGIVSISIHVSKLGLSDETLEAWDLDESEYFVLLIRFQDQYQPLSRILENSSAQGSISFRVGKCKKQKPSQSEAAAAFGISAHSNDKDTGFRRLFISASLEAFMNEGFFVLLRIRNTYGCSWEIANEKFYDHATARPRH